MISPRKTQAIWAGALAAAIIMPFFVYPVVLMNVLVFMLFACAFNLMLGFGGLLSFGHAAFFGSAAYVAGYAAKEWGLTFELAVACGVLIALFLGWLFALVAVRSKGIYFAMITLALSQMVYYIALQTPFTGGEDGIQSIPRPPLLGVIDISSNLALSYTILAIFTLAMLALVRISRSPFGQSLKAIRDNEDRAVSLGYNVVRYKQMAFVISAGFSGLAGSLKVFVFGIATLTDVSWLLSGEVVLMALLGGLGIMWAPALGALIVVAMQYLLAPYGAWVTIIQGLIFMGCVLLFREGIVGMVRDLLSRRRTNLKTFPN
ncbi:branched-chain amino acid ABC transporter permease [Alcanivorax sp. 24]|uniref:branched-chain amino acid ABC transporter permease n=1 Tax=Alcanivorax sp. 24 TaxID=2545266 RepID=UPI00105BF617|nr:branched-chain amino acid ABC transporter permease [Alcanivorax sp. 24]